MAAAAPAENPPFKIGKHGEPYANYHMMTLLEWRDRDIQNNFVVYHKLKNGIPLFLDVELIRSALSIQDGLVKINDIPIYNVETYINEPGAGKISVYTIAIDYSGKSLTNANSTNILNKKWSVEITRPDQLKDTPCIFVYGEASIPDQIQRLGLRSAVQKAGAQRSRRRKQSKRARKQKKRTRKH